LAFAGVIGGIGLWTLYAFVNPLTMWLTFATFIGYAVIYTVLLKPMTPQNIVIGGASGAMPPVLGWAAVTGGVAPEALLLFLIIFAWTPPHFWALALYRTEDFAKAGLPMLPGHARAPLHAAVRAPVYADSVRLGAAPFRLRDERLDLSRCRGRFERSIPGLRGAPLRELQRCARATHVPLLDRVSGAALRRAARRSFRVSAYLRTLFGFVLAAFALAGCGGSGPSFKNTDITGADYGRDFALTDHTGKTRTLADFRGKAVVMFFGYTRCPDVCPTTLAELKAVKEQLGEDGSGCRFSSSRSTRSATRKNFSRAMSRVRPSFLGLYGEFRGDRQGRKGLQGVLSEVAGKDTGRLYRGSHGGQLRLRSAGALAPVRASRQRGQPRGRCPGPVERVGLKIDPPVRPGRG